MRNFVLTSTSLTGGHPDKLCDRISDAVVDAYLTLDPASLVNAECAVASGIAFLAAHTHSSANVDLPAIVRGILEETGYADPDFNPTSVTILSSATPMLHAAADGGQPARAGCVNATVFGYACRHTPEMLPLSIVLAHRLTHRLSEVRLRKELPFLHPDGQAQVAVRYRNREPERVESITLFSALTAAAGDPADAQQQLHEAVVRPVLGSLDVPLSADAPVAVNPHGWGYAGGPLRHAGLTGRKSDVDTYGGYCRTGSAALSGKDPSRIDRSGAYLARYAAKNVVASGLARECEVQISYAMGRAEPISVELDTFGSAEVPEERILAALRASIDCSADGIAETFRLAGLPKARRGRFFVHLAAFGHLGRPDLDLPWERTDKAGELARLV